MLFETEARLRKELARLQDDTKNIEDWPNPAGQWGMYIKAHIEYVEGRLARLQKRNMKQP